ncbi:hypothetical protein CEXT_363581 [Caerostris extrusa]|uniref:Uncharacterized protein n=1 Tax=Caerostris extrusa TaxID=172846 RepID=A0AAV4T0P2_CAEEX|nr:hypothetical protein CEXT_363581 [Caerostris extrusa]
MRRVGGGGKPHLAAIESAGGGCHSSHLIPSLSLTSSATVTQRVFRSALPQVVGAIERKLREIQLTDHQATARRFQKYRNYNFNSRNFRPEKFCKCVTSGRGLSCSQPDLKLMAQSPRAIVIRQSNPKLIPIVPN